MTTQRSYLFTQSLTEPSRFVTGGAAFERHSAVAVLVGLSSTHPSLYREPLAPWADDDTLLLLRRWRPHERQHGYLLQATSDRKTSPTTSRWTRTAPRSWCPTRSEKWGAPRKGKKNRTALNYIFVFSTDDNYIMNGQLVVLVMHHVESNETVALVEQDTPSVPIMVILGLMYSLA